MSAGELTLSHDVFHFKAPYTRPIEIELSLENKSADHYVAYKVKTIDPKRYIVKPTNGVIAPGKHATVKVTFQALHNQAAVETFLKSKQKFLVQSRTLSSAPNPSDTGLTLMGKREGGPVTEKKIDCRYDGPADASASYKSVDDQGVPGKLDPIEAPLTCYQSSRALPCPDEHAAAGPVVTTDPAQPGSRCGLYLYLLALLVLLIALYVAFLKYGDKWLDYAKSMGRAK